MYHIYNGLLKVENSAAYTSYDLMSSISSEPLLFP